MQHAREVGSDRTRVRGWARSATLVAPLIAFNLIQTVDWPGRIGRRTSRWSPVTDLTRRLWRTALPAQGSTAAGRDAAAHPLAALSVASYCAFCALHVLAACGWHSLHWRGGSGTVRRVATWQRLTVLFRPASSVRSDLHSSCPPLPHHPHCATHACAELWLAGLEAEQRCPQGLTPVPTSLSCSPCEPAMRQPSHTISAV